MFLELKTRAVSYCETVFSAYECQIFDYNYYRVSRGFHGRSNLNFCIGCFCVIYNHSTSCITNDSVIIKIKSSYIRGGRESILLNSYCCPLSSTEVKLHNLTHKLTTNVWHNYYNHALVFAIMVVIYSASKLLSCLSV